MILCAGAYTNAPTSAGMVLYRFHDITGTLTRIADGARGKNPTYILQGSRYLYACDDKDDCGHIDAYHWDGSEEITWQGGCDLPGSVMCHIALWPGESYIAGANYMAGSVVICRLNKNGLPVECVDVDQHSGVGFDRNGRQDRPHVHFCCLTPDKRRMIVNDLGLDWSAVYLIDPVHGTISLDQEENQIYTEPGIGPRHMTFSQDGRFWYMTAEMGNKVLAYTYDASSGHSALLQSLSTLPVGFSNFNITSDIQLSPDGHFLYAANRGKDDIVCFHVDNRTGLLELAGQYDAHCSMVRTFSVLDRFIVLAGQKSGKIVVCTRDARTGALGEVVWEEMLSEVAYVGFLH